MSMVKVNPKLYGTCRLCLDDMGQYVIIPKVQEQIKYCFDIIVEPFDGMPQLLCNNCERILREYFEIKKKFILKQNDLLNNINDISERDSKGIEETFFEKCGSSITLSNDWGNSSPAVIKEEILSACVNNTNDTQQDKHNSNKNESNTCATWPSGYKKQFACRLCSYRGRYKTTMFRHIDKCHKNIRMKYKRILNNKYEVKIDKLDTKPNLTSVNNTVVIDSDKIIEDGDKDYYIIYILDHSKKLRVQPSVADNECTVKKRKKNSVSLNESIKPQKRKSTTLSNNAVKKDTETFNIECIYIEDSSDSAPEDHIQPESIFIDNEPESNNPVVESKENVKVVDLTEEKIAIIKDIISLCQTKYKENIILHPNESHTKSQLKHKILSIGRKIINKQGFNCTGLLRYMEHRNLEILWTPYTAKPTSDCNFVRIMTKLRGPTEVEDELGWKTLPPNTEVKLNSVTEPKLPDTQVLLVQCKKLLNENPVSNPRQMPRKSVITGKLNESLTPNATTNNPSDFSDDTNKTSTVDEPSVSALSMPIIDRSENINTKSNENCDTESPSNIKNNEVDLSAARIKVKPLSELLCNKGLNNFSNNESHSSALLIRDRQQNSPYASIFSPNDVFQMNHAVQPPQIFQLMDSGSQANQPCLILASHLAQPSVFSPSNNTIQAVRLDGIVQENNTVQSNHDKQNANTENRLASASPPTHTEHVIMDTPDFPNVKTHSPITYVKTLLQMHNIHLYERKQEFPEKYTCLIRLKVMYKQEKVEDAIVLSLSLLCHRNKFCMLVENAHQGKVVLDSISANWQWEIIRVFAGDVSNKLLLNAQNVNAETYRYAKTFIELLKSIKYIKQ